MIKRYPSPHPKKRYFKTALILKYRINIKLIDSLRDTNTFIYKDIYFSMLLVKENIYLFFKFLFRSPLNLTLNEMIKWN